MRYLPAGHRKKCLTNSTSCGIIKAQSRKETVTMKLILVLFISITLTLNFVASLVTVGAERDTRINRYDCVWNALLILAWGCMLRWWVL